MFCGCGGQCSHINTIQQGCNQTYVYQCRVCGAQYQQPMGQAHSFGSYYTRADGTYGLMCSVCGVAGS